VGSRCEDRCAAATGFRDFEVDLEVDFDAVLDEAVEVDATDLDDRRRCAAPFTGVFDTSVFAVAAFEVDARLPADFFFFAEADLGVPPE